MLIVFISLHLTLSKPVETFVTSEKDEVAAPLFQVDPLEKKVSENRYLVTSFVRK